MYLIKKYLFLYYFEKSHLHINLCYKYYVKLQQVIYHLNTKIYILENINVILKKL